ncbi:MAG: glycoside hydrolase family 95 protein, partial [Firmicutes bacterium]|nr:glycoside hydrolase family 95 protein [Bacillota bacterium]
METKLWYTQQANLFEEALPIGNGTLGAMVYGGVQKEKLSLNLDTLWSGKQQDYVSENAPAVYKQAQQLMLEGKVSEAEDLMVNKFNNMWSAYYLPMANLYIESDRADTTGYRRELDLASAIATTSFAGAVREAFVSFPHKCLVIRETVAEKASYTLRLDSQLQYKVTAEGNNLILSGRCPAEGGSRWKDSGYEPFIYTEDEGITFTLALKIITDGKVTAADDALTVQNASELTILAAAESSYAGHGQPYDETHEAKCRQLLDSAASAGFSALRAAHIEDHAALYNRVCLDLHAELCDLPTDKRLAREEKDKGLVELLFNYGRYLTIASSRPGSQATNLQGIWNEHLVAPWRANYTVNINTEMNYWPTLMCGLTECTQPLVEFIRKISQTGRAAAQNYYGAEGFTSHHNVDLWGHASPVGGRDNPSSNLYANWCLSSGWLCAHLFWQYEYTLDEDFLRSTAYPIMKEAAK